MVGLVLSLAAALATAQREHQLAQIELNGLANGYALTLQFRIGINMRKVAALRTLFDTVGTTVSRDQFATFTKQLLSDQIALVGMAWLPRVPREQREAHERAGAREGIAGYQIKSILPDGTRVPAPIETSISRSFTAQPGRMILPPTVWISTMAACDSGPSRPLATRIGQPPVRIFHCGATVSAF